MTSPPRPPAPETLQTPQQRAARQYLDLSELPDCLSVRVSVSIRAGEFSAAEDTSSKAAPPPR